MLIIKLILKKGNYFLGLLIAFNLLLGYFAPVARAEIKDSTNANNGMPTYRRDGGSRSNGANCIANNSQNVVAIIPEHTVALTASTSPKLFFYIPKTNQSKTLEFILRNEEDQLMYEAFLTTNGQGIIGVEVPAEVQADLLKEKQNYHWYLSMICDSQQRSKDIVVEGWMRPEEIDSTTKKQLAEADAVEQADLYYQQGLWHDALSVLVEHKNTDAVQEKLIELLDSVGLKELAAQPLVRSNLIEESKNSEISEHIFLP